MKQIKILWLIIVLLVGMGTVLQAKTPYQRGYTDGCRSARKGVIIRKTWDYNNRPNYRRGWWDGKRACKIGAGWNSYARGYSDGCRSARGNWHKNIRAYNRFRAYRRGWNAGWRNCRRPGVVVWNSYAKGYSDGCSTARGIWRKNVTAYRRFAAYRNGWNAGRRACSKKNNPWNNYNIGYRDGCSSARGIWTKNTHAFRVFPAYRRGWNAGWNACRRTVVAPGWNSYARGYRDGCSTGRGVWRKNRRAYRLYRAYRTGWIQGKRDCGIRRGVAVAPATVAAPTTVIQSTEVLEKAVQSDATANEISKLLFAAKEYIRLNYVKKPLPKAMELQVHAIKLDNEYAMVDVSPVYSDGTEISAEYIPEIPFQLCLKKNETGDWYVVYDLSHSGELSQEDLAQIRQEFPKDFPIGLLPEYWKTVMEGDGNTGDLGSRPGTVEVMEDKQPAEAVGNPSNEIPRQKK